MGRDTSGIGYGSLGRKLCWGDRRACHTTSSVQGDKPVKASAVGHPLVKKVPTTIWSIRRSEIIHTFIKFKSSLI